MSPQENCEHGVDKKFCFNCRFKDFKGLKVEMFENHHYVRLKEVEKLLSTEKASLLLQLEAIVGEDMKVENFPKLEEGINRHVKYIVEDTNIERQRIREGLNKLKE